MKGVIFNLAEEVVRAAHGEDAWDAVLEGAGLEGSWTSLGSYPDEHLARVVTSAAALLGQDEQAVLRVLAQGALPMLALRYPHFFQQHADASAFILTLNDVIHPEVLKLYPGATPPTFSFDRLDATSLTLTYASERRLCALAEGFVQGAAAYYHQTVAVSQSSCMLNGDTHCLLHCQFANATT
jgi:hypothetical protein